MNPISEARARFSHRMAMHLRVEPFRLRNETPMVSFTFDDVPKSRAPVLASMLDAHDVHGTFYVSATQVRTARRRGHISAGADSGGPHRGGHEIACHTF